MKRLILFLMLLLLIPHMVFAEEKNVVIDFSKMYEDGRNITMLQQAAMLYLMVSENLSSNCVEYEIGKAENDIFCKKREMTNKNGKALLVSKPGELSESLALAEGVTSDDNFCASIDFNPMNGSGSQGIGYSESFSHFMDIVGQDQPNRQPVPVPVPFIGPSLETIFSYLDDYDSICVQFEDLIPVSEDSDIMEINFYDKGANIFPNLTQLEIEAILNLLESPKVQQEFDQENGIVTLSTLEGKKLMTLYYNDDTNFYDNIEIAADLTEDDSLAFDLTEEELERLGSLFPYHSVVLNFVEKKAKPVPEEKPIINPSTFHNSIYIFVILGLCLLMGKKFLIKRS